MFEPLRFYTYSGGRQTTAILALVAQGKLPKYPFICANVGEDTESPEALTYIHEVARPFAEAHNIPLTIVRRPGPTLWQKLSRPENQRAGIPMMLSNGARAKRDCTYDFKVAVMDQWARSQAIIRAERRREVPLFRQEGKRLRAEGCILPQKAFHALVEERLWKASAISRPLVVTSLGISIDELQRSKRVFPWEWKDLDYPLITLRLSIDSCLSIIREAGLPLPAESSCWFCPYHRVSRWRKLQQNHPDLFEQGATFEEEFNRGRRQKMFFLRNSQPLRKAITQGQQELPWDDTCEDGYCEF